MEYKKPREFGLKDLQVYSTRLKARDVKKYDELKPILLAEGRRPPPVKKTKGIQAGEDDFSEDGDEYGRLARLNKEYEMVIHDWAKTPIYHILTRGTDAKKALFKYCNKATLNKLAGDLREKTEFEERTEIRARRQYYANR